MSIVLAIFGSAFAGLTAQAAAPAAEVVREMNLARQDPAGYAAFLEDMRGSYRGREGTRALEEAIRYLRSATPRAPFVLSPGISKAAADHCTAQAGGGMSHRGRGGSNAGDRMNRYGRWGGRWGENLSCGRPSARAIVIALIIDDGLPSRKHRENIFNAGFNFAGAAIGPHARFRTICSMAFAGHYVEDGAHDALVARN